MNLFAMLESLPQVQRGYLLIFVGFILLLAGFGFFAAAIHLILGFGGAVFLFHGLMISGLGSKFSSSITKLIPKKN